MEQCAQLAENSESGVLLMIPKWAQELSKLDQWKWDVELKCFMIRSNSGTGTYSISLADIEIVDKMTTSEVQADIEHGIEYSYLGARFKNIIGRVIPMDEYDSKWYPMLLSKSGITGAVGEMGVPGVNSADIRLKDLSTGSPYYGKIVELADAAIKAGIYVEFSEFKVDIENSLIFTPYDRVCEVIALLESKSKNAFYELAKRYPPRS
jgi:hypothetical protein